MRVAILKEGAVVVDSWLFGAPFEIKERLKELDLSPQVVFTTSLKSPGMGSLGSILSFKEMPLTMNGMSAKPILKKHGTDYSIESADGRILFSERGDVSAEDVAGYNLAIIKNKHRTSKFGDNVISWPWTDSEYLIRENVTTPLERSLKVWSDSEDIPSTLKSLGVSLEQANQIARIAEASGEEGEENWAIAISTFKKGHVKKDNVWIKREKETKVSKEEANYREAGPDNEKRCGTCIYYLDHACSKVEGEIEPGMISDIYMAKTEKEWVEGYGPIQRFGDLLISELHTAYNNVSDSHYRLGYMNEDERKGIGKAIGAALDALRENAPKEVMQRVISGNLNARMYELPEAVKEIVPTAPDKIPNGWSTVYKDESGQDRWASISSVAVEDQQGETFSTKAMDWALGFAKMVNFKGPLRYRHVPGLDGGDADKQVRVGDFLIESGTFRNNAMGEKLKELMGQTGMGVSLGLLFAEEDIVDKVYQRALIFERSVTPKPAVPYTSIIIKGKEVDMKPLTEMELKALAEELKMDLAEVKTMYERATQAGPLGLKEFQTVLKEKGLGTETEEEEVKLSKKDMKEILESLTVSEFKQLEGMIAEVKAASSEEDPEEDEDEEEEEYVPMPMAKKKKKESDSDILQVLKEQSSILAQQNQTIQGLVQAMATNSGNKDLESAVQKVLAGLPRQQAQFVSTQKEEGGTDKPAADAAILAKLAEIEKQISVQPNGSLRDAFTSKVLNAGQ